MPDKIPERREGDKRAASIDRRLETIENYQQSHLLDYHANLAVGDAGLLISEHNEMKKGFEAMSLAIQGEPEKDFAGNIIQYNGGMKDQLNDLEYLVRNGGIPARVRLTIWQKFFALATAVVYLTVEVIRFTGGT